jgi:hypothetical protein
MMTFMLLILLFDYFLASLTDGVGIAVAVLSSLVPVKPNRLTRSEREKFFLTPNLKEILVGLLLGDLCIQKQAKVLNARLLFVFMGLSAHKN